MSMEAFFVKFPHWCLFSSGMFDNDDGGGNYDDDEDVCAYMYLVFHAYWLSYYKIIHDSAS